MYVCLGNRIQPRPLDALPAPFPRCVCASLLSCTGHSSFLLPGAPTYITAKPCKPQGESLDCCTRLVCSESDTLQNPKQKLRRPSTCAVAELSLAALTKVDWIDPHRLLQLPPLTHTEVFAQGKIIHCTTNRHLFGLVLFCLCSVVVCFVQLYCSGLICKQAVSSHHSPAPSLTLASPLPLPLPNRHDLYQPHIFLH